jgi:DNA adenine methylase
LQRDYQSVPIPEGALIYCDPPYAETNCGKYDGFDSERFYEWADRQDNIFISEYTMPDNFIPIAEIEKPILSTANGTTQKAVERLYTNERTWAAMDEDTRLIYRCNMAEQLTFAL